MGDPFLHPIAPQRRSLDILAIRAAYMPRMTTSTTERWPPPGSLPRPEWNMPGWGTTIWRGMLGKCPACGKAPIFNGYLRVHDRCAVCAAPLGQMPADDTPPYIAMLVVLHFAAFFIILGFRLKLHPGPFAYAFLLLLLAAICMVALRSAKGAVIGILLKLGTKRGVLG
jgi:uncharacterized protein (DUF983 family)